MHKREYCETESHSHPLWTFFWKPKTLNYEFFIFLRLFITSSECWLSSSHFCPKCDQNKKMSEPLTSVETRSCAVNCFAALDEVSWLQKKFYCREIFLILWENLICGARGKFVCFLTLGMWSFRNARSGILCSFSFGQTRLAQAWFAHWS